MTSCMDLGASASRLAEICRSLPKRGGGPGGDELHVRRGRAAVVGAAHEFEGRALARGAEDETRGTRRRAEAVVAERAYREKRDAEAGHRLEVVDAEVFVRPEVPRPEARPGCHVSRCLVIRAEAESASRKVASRSGGEAAEAHDRGFFCAKDRVRFVARQP